jgi:hypothetical protein
MQVITDDVAARRGLGLPGNRKDDKQSTTIGLAIWRFGDGASRRLMLIRNDRQSWCCDSRDLGWPDGPGDITSLGFTLSAETLTHGQEEPHTLVILNRQGADAKESGQGHSSGDH